MQTQLNTISNSFGKIGLIAGNGDLPEKMIVECLRVGREIAVINISDTDPPSLSMVPHTRLNISAVGKAIAFLRRENVDHIVFAGGLQRPKFSALRPDATGLMLLARISKARLIGDNSLLSIIIRFFEEHGFAVIGVDEVLTDMLMPRGILGRIEPDKQAAHDIDIGLDIARSIGELDIGQSIIIQNGVVIGVEAVEGTDRLIARCQELQQSGPGSILVKVKKPGQDSRIDLPTIGVTTIKNVHAAGLQGIAVEAGSALVIDRLAVVAHADEMGIFLVGV